MESEHDPLVAAQLRTNSNRSVWGGEGLLLWTRHKSRAVSSVGLCLPLFGWINPALKGVHLRHHEVGLLRHECVLLVDQLDPVLDHFRRAVAACR